MKGQTMKRILIVALVSLAVPAYAAEQAWSAAGTSGFSVKGVCAAGTTCDAPSDATKGMNLEGVFRIAVQVCADSGQTITDGDGLAVYWYDGRSGLWGKSGLSLTVGIGARCAWAEGDSPGHGIPVLVSGGPASSARVAVVPTAMTVSSGGLTVWIYAADSLGRAL